MTLKFSAFNTGGAIADTDTVVGLRTPGTNNLQWLWSQVKTYLGIGTLAATTITGSSGSAKGVCPNVGGNFKIAMVTLAAFKQTGAAQKYTFETAFAVAPIFLANTVPECTVDTTGITLPGSMAGGDPTITGTAIVMGA